MDQKVTLQQMISFVFMLLLGGMIMYLVVGFSNPSANQSTSALSENQTGAASEEVFDYEYAADISAMRWQAMGHFYDAQGLLTRDDFDYERAADIIAYRWDAMAEAYERLGLLNDHSNPDNVMMTPWQILLSAYEKAGLLND